ncbi:MAG: Gfo/Idh/MocA family oxidoreductase [bacterium]|nr:Gfo/Idh/MocA family oxidoreductase [bacterium]
MRALIVGLGSIGKRHLKNLKEIDPSISLAVLRQHKKEAKLNELSPLVEELFLDKNSAFNWKPDMTLIANPGPFHIQTALDSAKNNSHLFIEKPFSVEMQSINELIQECQSRKLVLMVGYMLRFFEPLQLMRQALLDDRIGRLLCIRATVGQYLPDWRPTQDYRQGVSACKKLGGGAIFELSHEIDYTRWLGGEVDAVTAQAGKFSDLEIDVEDIAEIILHFKNNAIGSIHVDMVDRASNRSCRLIGTEGTLVWDMNKNLVQLYRFDNKLWADLYNVTELDRNKMYIDELEHFLQCIKNKKEALINGYEGKKVLEIILAAKQSVAEGKTVTL